MIFSSEWTYLLTKRIVAGNDSAFSYVRLKYGSNLTDTVSGVIIYPDDFSFAEAGVGALNFGANYAVTQIDATTWEALEEMGCVFLPTATSFDLPTYDERTVGLYAFYWSSTAASAAQALQMVYNLGTNPMFLRGGRSDNRFKCFSVRLAQDIL